MSGLKSDVYNTTGSLEVALLSCFIDEHVHGGGSGRRVPTSHVFLLIGPHAAAVAAALFFRKRWDRLTQRTEGVEAVAPAAEVVEVAKKKGEAG